MHIRLLDFLPCSTSAHVIDCGVEYVTVCFQIKAKERKLFAREPYRHARATAFIRQGWAPLIPVDQTENGHSLVFSVLLVLLSIPLRLHRAAIRPDIGFPALCPDQDICIFLFRRWSGIVTHASDDGK